MGRYQLNRFPFLFCFLFFLFSTSSASIFFDLAAKGLDFLSKSIVSTFEPTNPLTLTSSTLSSCISGDIDEGFAVVSEYEDEWMSEREFSRLLEEIKSLRAILSRGEIRKNSRRQFEIIQILADWRDNPKNRYAAPWREHFVTLTEVLKARGRGIHIPNTILRDYLTFVRDNIIKYQKGTIRYRKIIEKTVDLIAMMLRTATDWSFLEIIIVSVCKDLWHSHTFKLFHTLHDSLSSFAILLDRTVPENRSRIFSRMIGLYLGLLNYFELSLNDSNDLKALFITPLTFFPFIELVPLYKSMITVPSDCADIRKFKYVYNGNFLEYLKIFDLFLKFSHFNHNFMLPDTFIHFKHNLFIALKDILIGTGPLLNTLQYAQSFKLIYLYEALLIFSAKDDEFFNAILYLLEGIMRNASSKISDYALLLAVCPEITIEIVDSMLMALIDNKPPNDINISHIRGFRRMICAVQSIDYGELIWDMNFDLLDLLLTDEFDAHDCYFLHSARIYLYRRFSIPLSITAVGEDIAEDLDWREAVAYVNFILERERKKFSPDGTFFPVITNQK